MIQEIAPHRLSNTFQNSLPRKAADCVLYYKNNEVLLLEEAGRFYVPTVEQVPNAYHFVYLFSIDGISYWGLRDDLPLQIEGCSFQNVKKLRDSKAISKMDYFAVVTGYHLFVWHQDNRFCGRCGHPTTDHSTERAKICPACGHIVYPRIIPAVIVGIIYEDRLLLTKYRQGYPHYALVAGFTEIGETLEETVQREVMEETGLSVKNIRYYKSQPWGIVQDLLVGFFCEADGDATIHMDKQELKEARWFHRDEIKFHPDGMSLTNDMIQHFLSSDFLSGSHSDPH